MRYRQLGFIEKKDGGVSLTSDKKWLTTDLQGINPKAVDIFNAIIYLVENGYIHSKERVTEGARIYVGISMSGRGIDIIEGIEGSEEGRETFSTAFNIAAGDSVESMIADHLGMLSSQ